MLTNIKKFVSYHNHRSQATCHHNRFLAMLPSPKNRPATIRCTTPRNAEKIARNRKRRAIRKTSHLEVTLLRSDERISPSPMDVHSSVVKKSILITRKITRKNETEQNITRSNRRILIVHKSRYVSKVIRSDIIVLLYMIRSMIL